MSAKKNPAAVALGRIKSEKKAVKARANGKRGGRPVKPLADFECKCDKKGEFDPALHRSDCLYAQAIKRRKATGKPLT